QPPSFETAHARVALHRRACGQRPRERDHHRVMVVSIAKADEVLDAEIAHALPIVGIRQRNIDLAVAIVARSPGRAGEPLERCSMRIGSVTPRLFDGHRGWRWRRGECWFRRLRSACASHAEQHRNETRPAPSKAIRPSLKFKVAHASYTSHFAKYDSSGSIAPFAAGFRPRLPSRQHLHRHRHESVGLRSYDFLGLVPAAAPQTLPRLGKPVYWRERRKRAVLGAAEQADLRGRPPQRIE